MKFLGKKNKLDEAIDDLLDQMKTVGGSSMEYGAMVKNLAILQAAKTKVAERRIKWDTILLVAGNLGGIALILFKEEADIITSKALSFVLKGRV